MRIHFYRTWEFFVFGPVAVIGYMLMCTDTLHATRSARRSW